MMYDTVIIGSGAAGLGAAIYAQRAKLNAVVLEKEYLGTGQIAESACVDNYPGLPGISGFDLGEKLREHAVNLGAVFVETEATSLEPFSAGWCIRLKGGTSLESKTVIYAAGATHRKLQIPGEEEFSGRGVSYCAVCDGAFYQNRTVVVVGGGDTALADALLLARQANEVFLLHRRRTFRANPSLEEAVRQTANIHLILEAHPTEVVGENTVTGMRYRQNDEEKWIPVDGVFVAVGSEPNTKLLRGIAQLDVNGYVYAREDGKTTASGLFAAGDVRTKALRQVLTAAADGANCVESVREFLNLGFMKS